MEGFLHCLLPHHALSMSDANWGPQVASLHHALSMSDANWGPQVASLTKSQKELH
jgi:hypothetical protein